MVDKKGGILERLIGEAFIKTRYGYCGDSEDRINSKDLGITEEPDSRELVLLCVDGIISAEADGITNTEEVLFYMQEHGLRPEGPEYIIRHYQENPEAMKGFVVAALDPKKLYCNDDGTKGCVIFNGLHSFNYLRLAWYNRRWDVVRNRFIASKKAL